MPQAPSPFLRLSPHRRHNTTRTKTPATPKADPARTRHSTQHTAHAHIGPAASGPRPGPRPQPPPAAARALGAWGPIPEANHGAACRLLVPVCSLDSMGCPRQRTVWPGPACRGERLGGRLQRQTVGRRSEAGEAGCWCYLHGYYGWRVSYLRDAIDVDAGGLAACDELNRRVRLAVPARWAQGPSQPRAFIMPSCLGQLASINLPNTHPLPAVAGGWWQTHDRRIAGHTRAVRCLRHNYLVAAGRVESRRVGGLDQVRQHAVPPVPAASDFC